MSPIVSPLSHAAESTTEAPASAAIAASAVPLISALAVVQGHDRTRRRRLVTLMALCVAGVSLILLPSVFVPTLDSISLVALLITALSSSAAFALNRTSQVGVASSLLLGGGTLGIGWLITARALQQGLTPTDLRLYDFFLLPIVLSGVIANRRMPAILACLTGTFTALSLLLLPHTPSLQLYWTGHDPQTIGSSYDVIAIPLVIQLLTAAAAWLGADSMRRSLLSATRADELRLANERILAQAQELEWRQQQLRHGISHLHQVHAEFAHGNFDARAQFTDRELQPLAISLNHLLMQMQRLLREQGQRSRIETAAHELAVALRRMRVGGGYTAPAYTGSTFDEALLELNAAYQQGLLSRYFSPTLPTSPYTQPVTRAAPTWPPAPTPTPAPYSGSLVAPWDWVSQAAPADPPLPHS